MIKSLGGDPMVLLNRDGMPFSLRHSSDDDNLGIGNVMPSEEALSNQLPLNQIGMVPLEDIIGTIPEAIYNRWYKM